MANSNCLTREEIRFLEELGVQGDLHHLSRDSSVWGEIEDKAGDEQWMGRIFQNETFNSGTSLLTNFFLCAYNPDGSLPWEAAIRSG